MVRKISVKRYLHSYEYGFHNDAILSTNESKGHENVNETISDNGKYENRTKVN